MIDNTLLVTCNDIGRQQLSATENTYHLCQYMLNYMASHPNPSITFYKSDMQLWVVADTSYLSVPKARSRVGGYHYLEPYHQPHILLADQRTFINAPIHVECSILKSVVGAASEAEIAASYANTRKAIPFRIALLKMGHPQATTLLETDNDTAYGILTSTIIPKRSKAIDMRFFWLWNRKNQGQFKLYWYKGIDNLADYFTKHHTTPYHKKMRKIYLLSCLIGTY